MTGTLWCFDFIMDYSLTVPLHAVRKDLFNKYAVPVSEDTPSERLPLRAVADLGGRGP